jgi:hypothetical protein
VDLWMHQDAAGSLKQLVSSWGPLSA